MKKFFTLMMLIVIMLILDNAFMPFLAVRGYYPSLVFVFVFCYSIVNGKGEGIWIGAAAGLLQDIYFFQGFGVNALLTMLMCAVAGEIGNSIFKDKRFIPVISCFFLYMVKGTLTFVILYIVGQTMHIEAVLFNSIYAMVICMFMYKRVYKLCQLDYMQKKWKF